MLITPTVGETETWLQAVLHARIHFALIEPLSIFKLVRYKQGTGHEVLDGIIQYYHSLHLGDCLQFYCVCQICL